MADSLLDTAKTNARYFKRLAEIEEILSFGIIRHDHVQVSLHKFPLTGKGEATVLPCQLSFREARKILISALQSEKEELMRLVGLEPSGTVAESTQ